LQATKLVFKLCRKIDSQKFWVKIICISYDISKRKVVGMKLFINGKFDRRN
jgi:hypothetical protein